MGTTGFDQLAAAGVRNAEAQRDTRTSMDMLTRQLASQQWKNAAANVKLPPQQIKDETTGQMIENPDFQKAMETRAKYLKSAMDVYSPEHHANLWDAFHGLITGKQEGAHPQTLPTPNGTPTATQGSTPGHAFQMPQPGTPNHSLMAEGDKILHGIGQHLKAFVQPIAPKQTPDYTAWGGATEEERKNDATMALQKQRGADALAAANARGSNARPAHIGDVTPKDAINNIRNLGYEYADEEGNPISEAELAEAPDYMKLVEFRQGNKTFAKLVDQRSKEWNIGGKIYQAGELGKQTPETLSELGQATSTLPRTSVTTATSPGGGQVMTGGTTRSTAPVGVTAPTPTAAPGAVPTLKTRPTIAPKASGPVSSKSPKVPSAETGDILPNIQTMTPQNANRAAKAQPAVTALMGLYGDPRNPTVKSMADFASLANDQHAQKVLGKAFQLLDQEMGDVSDGGVINTLGSLAGWAGFKASVAARIQREAGSAMTPAEKEYFDTAIASMADIIGSRAATGQSPARFSVKAMQNELPLIGSSSVTDQSSYLTKMNTIARQIEVGLNAMPDNSRALNYLLKRQNDLIKQGNAGSKKLNPQSSQSPQVPGQHQYAIDSDGKRRKVIDPNATLPDGWKWAD